MSQQIISPVLSDDEYAEFMELYPLIADSPDEAVRSLIRSFNASRGATALLKKETIAQALRSVAEKYAIAEAYLFGSYARGEATGASDIDIAVVGGPGFSPTNIFAISGAIERLTGKTADVVDLGSLDESSSLYAEIMRDKAALL